MQNDRQSSETVILGVRIPIFDLHVGAVIVRQVNCLELHYSNKSSGLSGTA